jgi:hypothetical protein
MVGGKTNSSASWGRSKWCIGTLRELEGLIAPGIVDGNDEAS